MLENRNSADSQLTGYRPDLDGLRAVAVSSVIAFHLHRDAVPGGYLGVDIFFVLSGYLITSIIWRELLLGKFSLGTFYNRRIRRIMPALLFVILVTGLVSWLVLLPLDLVGFGRSVFAALAFAANFYFWRDTDYFSRLAEEKPLLHIWSLGVEEQFYLLFPLLLFGLARTLRSRAVAVVAALVAISLAADLLALSVGAALPAFYLLPTRAWELGVGALLALAPATGWSERAATLLGLAGAVLIALALACGQALLGPAVPAGLTAVAGTALVIRAGQDNRGGVRRALAWPPLVFVGLISYSLYLWHWPVIVLGKYYLIRDLAGLEVIAAILLMLGAAVLSWRFIERPFRSLAMPTRTVHLSVLAGALGLAACAGLILSNDGLPSRLSPEAARLNASVGTNYRCPVSSYIYFPGSRACALDLPSRDPADADIVLFGNSHAQMYAPLIRDIGTALSKRSLLVPMNHCTPTLGFNVSSRCRKMAEGNLDAIVRLERARLVILATTWDAALPQLLRGLDRTIERLGAAGKKVILVGPLASPNWQVASEVSRTLAFGHGTNRPLFKPRERFVADFGAVFAHFEGRGDVELARPDRVQCDAAQCRYVIEGRALFADSNHVAQGELARFRPAIEPAMRSAFR